MDFDMFANSLTIDEVNELSHILYEIQKRNARENMLRVDVDEMVLIEQGYFIDAIKVYKRRTSSSLMTAKLACEDYRTFDMYGRML